MSAAQCKTLLKVAAAVCDCHGWSEKGVIGHGEWGSPGRWDPGYKRGHMLDMADVRADVKKALKSGGKPPTKPDKPKPRKPSVPPFPGRGYFRPGASSKYVTQLGKLLVKRGYGRYHKEAPGRLGRLSTALR
ncbi:hypothetical protein [Streptomyces sp. NPDC017941]|uniref:hypothetical protein n=1 Tax=Streptomyces sp. NPDC017941 TaxID=3365018 RepID=UPI0037979661